MESVLKELEQERDKFSKADQEKINTLCRVLVEHGVYPYDDYEYARKMVENYGAYWHQYKEPLNCPHCDADLRNLESGPPFKREIYVKCIHNSHKPYLECPDCGEVIYECIF